MERAVERGGGSGIERREHTLAHARRGSAQHALPLFVAVRDERLFRVVEVLGAGEGGSVEHLDGVPDVGAGGERGQGKIGIAAGRDREEGRV